MATTAEVRLEEREARERQRQVDRLQRERAKAAEREQRSKLSGVIREQLAKPRARHCRCGITPRTTKAELYALGEGCTRGRDGHAGWICPALDAIRRNL